MKSSGILLVDSIVNFLLGILLLIFPRVIMKFLGLPLIESAFYPSILGAVLIGIAIALFLIGIVLRPILSSKQSIN